MAIPFPTPKSTARICPVPPILASSEVRPAPHRSAAGDQPAALFERLKHAFEVPLAELHLATGELNHVTAEWLPIDLDRWSGLIEEVVRRGRPEIIEDCAPLLVLAVPLPSDETELCDRVALGSFVTVSPAGPDSLSAAAAAVGCDPQSLSRWAALQPIWPARAVEQLSRLVGDQFAAQQQNVRLKAQLTNVSRQLVQTFDELNLLHRINERLSLANDERDLLELAVDWLSSVLPAECLLACVETDSETSDGRQSGREWVYAGECPLPEGELDKFLERLGPDAQHSMVVVDREMTAAQTCYYPTVREAISVPIRIGDSVHGWLIAVNRRADAGRAADDFGDLETSLLSSVASVLGMHAGNVQMFRDQEAFFESVVRAFSSAIDAKDHYTRGHSERVARIAVLLARQLGCSIEEQNTVYLSGLLHDIGKIGIDDQILRKPEQLTAEEFEHIKRHPELGFQILSGVRQLEPVLPVVLHHHESINGKGYPGKLVGDEIPWLARIVAVADAFDAMSSDRPYRKGMPAERLDQIFRAEAGQQWDPAVVDAFFAIRNEIDAVVHEGREQLSLDVNDWTVG